MFKFKRGKMAISTQGLILIIIAAILMSAGSLGLKGSITAIGGFGSDFNTLLSDIFALLRNPIFLLGLFLYGTGTLLWMKVIASEPLSVGYPILLSVAFIAVTLGAVLFFRESLSPVKLVGMFVIVIGVVITTNG
jgi:multidrug transporter EmrE-like cation transporter